ncbi:hypothetical protein KKH56_08640, partial [bacterium]|nr:hypothetical protein [bacterium]
ERRSSVVQAFDPNDKASPAGFDPEGTLEDQRKYFIASDRLLPYTVFFENLDTATAAAQEVLLTDQLDSNLDWSSFALGTMQIGEKTVSVPESAQNFTTEVDLRPAISTIVEVACEFNPITGLATWLFRGKNPYTDELADFLPPNKEEVAPQGEGWISYTVKSRQNLSTGTVIRNKATIDFEVDIPPEPMETPEVFNTIDAGIPISSVSTLAEYQEVPDFKVSWSGNDDEKGSGIRDYTIYVSDNEDPYTLWITTDATSAVFAGQDGHTYRFYSIIRDNVGNIESAPETPDAETTVTVTAIQEGIAVSPNPFVPTRGHTQISFFGTGLPYSKIKIYNKAAELVITLEETEGKTQLDWNATNDDGKKLASGVYIWVSTNQAGNHEKGKFAIIK